MTLLLLFFIQNCFADERVLVQPHQSSNSKIYYVLYGEDDHFILDIYQRTAGRFQVRVNHEVYSSRTAAQAALSRRGIELSKFRSPSRQTKDETSVQTKVKSNDLMDKTGAIWTATESWTLDWESRYQAWIETEVDSNFFNHYKVATDCADVAYALRWIFARQNHLPAGNHLGGTNDLMTNDSVDPEWMSLPTSPNWHEDQRFRAALDYLLENTYTHTLLRDSYPVELSAQSLIAGGFFVYLYDDTGHTLNISHTDYTPDSAEWLRVLSSTTPREIRTLYDDIFERTEGVRAGESGFLRHRWLEKIENQWVTREPEKMPWYSLGQYDKNFINFGEHFDEAVYRHLLGHAPNPVGQLRNTLYRIKDLLQRRVSIVARGYEICSVPDVCAPGTNEYESWSTFQRDKRIGDNFHNARRIRSRNFFNHEIQKLWYNFQDQEMIKIEGRSLRFSRLHSAWKFDRYSSDPNQSILRRWGEH